MGGKRLRAVRGIVSLLLLAAGASSAEPFAAAPAPPRSQRGGRLVIGVRGDVTSFNIYTATNAFTQEISDLLFPKLAAEQDDFRDGPPTFRPALAESWKLSADRMSLTVHLAPAKWSDGREVTAADVLFSHRAAISSDVGWVGSDVKEIIAEVSAPDPRTVVYRFKRSYPYELMDAFEGNVLPAHVYEKVPYPEWPKHAFLDAPVAGGPFRLKRYERGSMIELERNPGYFRQPGTLLETVVFRILPDETTLVNELLSGGIDFMENLSEEAAKRVERSPRLRIVRVPDLAYAFVCWNTSRPPFSDPRVRRALTMAIDRRAILEGLLPRTGRPSNGPILSFMWAHDPSLAAVDYDPAAARRLLVEAGFTDPGGGALLTRDGHPFRFELETNQGSALRNDAVEMIAAQLRKIGVEAVPRILEFGAITERHERHDFDAFVSSWRESTKVDLKSVFHSASITGGYNYGSYRNADLDALIDRARVESDDRLARDLWRQAERIVVADQPFTFLFERDRLHAIPRRLEGMRLSPRSAYANLEEWSLTTEAQAAP